MALGNARSAGPGDLLTFPLLRRVLDLEPGGYAVEFGVGVGTSLQLIAERMPAVGFDSFEGLPEEWRPGFPKGCLAFQPPQVENTQIVVGWFADTLPGFNFAGLGRIGLVHLDADLYSSTATALKYVGPHLRSGCYIVFDEYFACGYSARIARAHEQRAWREFVRDKQISWTVIGRSDQEWAIRLR